MTSNIHLIVLLLLNLHPSRQQENQNYLNYPQGRFLSSFPQNPRNGFFPVDRTPQQQQQQPSGNYHQQDLFLDGPSTPSFFPFNQPFATTRSPNPFEISPRPFGVTASPIQTRGQFSNFAQQEGRQNSNYHFESNPYNFQPSSHQQQQPQRINPYLDTTGYSESSLADEYEDRQPYVKPQKTRTRGSQLRTSSNENKSTERSVPSQTASTKSNKDRFLENLRQRPTTTATTPETFTTITTTPRPRLAKEQPSKKSRYTPITRSTTSKRPQPKQTESDFEYNDQKYSFSKNNKVKAPSHDLNVKPLNGYHVNISHSEKKPNDLSVKALHHDNTREYVEENSEEDEEDYVDYEEDYGVILNEEERALKETTTSKPEILTTQSPLPTTTSTTFSPTTQKQEDQTVIIFDNFILPKSNKDEEKNEEEIEYEYEYEDETEEPEIVKTTDRPVTTKFPEYDVEVTTYRDPKRILGEAVVSVVTSKTIVNGSVSEVREEREETTTEPENYPSIPIKSTTDNYVVVASVQTSRSVSGAHFLPFPHVEQKERKQSRAELVSKKAVKEESVTDLPEVKTTQISETENVSAEIEDDEEQLSDYTTKVSYYEEPSTTIASTVKNSPMPSTESIIDKLDGIQSDLSLGVLSGEFPVLKDASSVKKSKGSTTETPEPVEISTTVKPIVLIRKFSPKSTTVKPTSAPRTTSTTTENIHKTTIGASTTTESSQRANKKISFDNIPQDDVAGLLPPGFKPRNSFKNKKIQTTTTTQQPIVKDEVKIRNATIGRSFKSQPAGQELNSKFKSKDKLKNDTESSTKKTYGKLFEASNDEIDISKFLPPDFKEKAKNDSLAVIPLEHDELSKFLPPGFKIGTTTKAPALPKVKVVEDDISKFLPPGYKAPLEEKEDEKDSLSSILSKIKFQETANLLPPGFKEDASSTAAPAVEESTAKPTNKLVFPTRLGKKPSRVTTPKAQHGEGPKPPEIKIMKGPPTRATTEFTGWPSKPTTPISIEKLLELQKNAGAIEINISDILSKTTEEATTTTSTTPSTTTTTTTTTQRPESATICRNEVCSLAATIRIIDGVEWSPELLTHHTDEYKKLARELEASLNEVYTNSPSLKQYFRNIRIDSFSKGSVLVDYFIEFSDIPSNGLKTAEVKRMFHEALTPVSQFNNTNNEDEGSPQPIVKEAFKLGNFVVDPVSTDFIVIQKVAGPALDEDDENVLLPQWAIAMISIGSLSLAFMIIFGVTVLINKKKAAKKKAPTPLTADMLNELNKNHMGGFDNYGAEDDYNLDDTWDERRQDIKPKRVGNSTKGSNPNIYDSWRSQHIQRYQADEFYYDSHDPYNELQPKQYQQQAQAYAGTNRFMEPNWNDGWNDPTYQSSHNYSRKYYRDYDQHF